MDDIKIATLVLAALMMALFVASFMMRR